MLKVIYVAGPFRGANSWVVESNIRRAETASLQLWNLGAAVICPHTNTRFFDGAVEDRHVLTGDLEILKRCDAIYLLPDWMTSDGAKAERDFAIKHGKAILTDFMQAAAFIQEAPCE